MKILSHKGYWISPEEKNTFTAFERSFKAGFGIETDLRDHKGKIVISHDMPVGKEMKLKEFLNLANEYSSTKKPLTLALNIKADGLHKEVVRLTSQYTKLKCFVFDMSIPDMRFYLDQEIDVFTRLSEMEIHPVFYKQSQGVWLDNFSKSLWFDIKYLTQLLKHKSVCVVSSELHGHNHHELWALLKPLTLNPNLALCTDRPIEAKQYLIDNL